MIRPETIMIVCLFIGLGYVIWQFESDNGRWSRDLYNSVQVGLSDSKVKGIWCDTPIINSNGTYHRINGRDYCGDIEIKCQFTNKGDYCWRLEDEI